MPNFGPTELIIILVIIIAIFGAGKIADLGGSLGKGVRDFKEAVKQESAPEEEGDQEPAPKAGLVKEASDAISEEADEDTDA